MGDVRRSRRVTQHRVAAGTAGRAGAGEQGGERRLFADDHHLGAEQRQQGADPIDDRARADLEEAEGPQRRHGTMVAHPTSTRSTWRTLV